MLPAAPTRTLEVRHVQLGRAVIAAAAAALITFSPDHSAQVGLSVFSGFTIVTALLLLLAAWSVYPRGARWPMVTVGVIGAVAGLVGSVGNIRSTTLFFVLVIGWAALTGVVEVVAGARALKTAGRGTSARSDARDTATVGILSVVLAIALALVPSGFALQYHIDDAGQSFTLTGITIAVGVLGGYAAVLAVYLAIAGFSPRQAALDEAPADDERKPA